MKAYTINPLTFTRIHHEIEDPACQVWSAQSVVGKFRISQEDGLWWAFDPVGKEWMKCGSFAQGAVACDEMLVQYLEADTLKEVENEPSHAKQGSQGISPDARDIFPPESGLRWR